MTHHPLSLDDRIPEAPPPLKTKSNFDATSLVQLLNDKENKDQVRQIILENKDWLIQLLEEEPEEKAEDKESPLKGITLNDAQQFIYDDIIAKKNEINRIISVEGAAGTGKSTITSALINHFYFDTTQTNEIAILAPTHQALAVIKNMVKRALNFTDFDLERSYDLHFKTAHSFLGLKLVIDDNGNEMFRAPEPDKAHEVIYCDYLFVDESSMIDRDFANQLIGLLGRRIRKQIIFIGDRYQTKPVNGEMNLIFDKRNSAISRYDLREVVRQKTNSDITIFSQWLVECIDDNEQFDTNELIRRFTTPASDISCYNNVPQFLEKYFETQADKIVGCYTNVSVKSYNDYIRYVNNKDQYPEGIPEYIVGDKLIFLQPYERAGTPIYNNGDIVELKRVEYKTDFNKELYYWFCEDDEGEIFKILDDRYLPLLQDKLDKIANLAKATDGTTRRNHWASFFRLKNKFAKVRPVFANTFHKLQGSTYDEVFINCDEFFPYMSRDLDNILRLIYVAITRGRRIHLLKQ